MVTLERGQRFGRYELVSLLGAGAVGSVWEACLQGPAGFRKNVALKVLARPGDRAANDFVHEARVGALVNHPNVVATLDLVVEDGTLAIAMELVRGATAAQLARGGLGASALVELGAQAATGLHHVHMLSVDGAPNGLVHRDVKPANLMVDGAGTTKVTDLGVSRLAGQRGGMSGTPGYMAPEQADGVDDKRADVFSLGATLWALATGESPFGRGEQALARIRAVERTLDDSSFLVRADQRLPGLGDVIRTCLRADPELRFDTALQVAQALLGLRSRATGPTLLEVLAGARPDLRIDPSQLSVSPSESTVVIERGHLPLARDAFVGRVDEVRQLVERLRGPERIVTLLGPGGMGKTRTAIEAARTVRPNLPGGSWFVDLASVYDAGSICGAVADLLDIRLDFGEPTERLGHALASRPATLLVLDNLEQVVDEAAVVVARWLELAPELKVLGTSRIALRIQGEHRFPIGPLSVGEGTELFLRRAPRPPGAEDRPVVEALVAELDGMPLAIELAAARTRMLRVDQIRTRLADRWRLLTATERDRPDRHRSVRASLDGSWELLTPSAQLALAQLSVFEGPFSPEAAEAVVERDSDGGWVLDSLVELADHSLLQIAGEGQQFTLLQVVREYAKEQLGALGEDARRRHAAWFAQLGTETALDALHGRGSEVWTTRLSAASSDLIAACRGALARGEGSLAIPLARAAAEAVAVSGPLGVDRELLDGALALATEPAAILALTLARADSAIRSGASAHAEALLAPLEASASGAAGVRCLQLLATARGELGRPSDAVSTATRALALARAAGDRWAEGHLSTIRGAQLTTLGQITEARQELQVALRCFREVGSPRDEARVWWRLGSVATDTGETALARELILRALELGRRHATRRELGVMLSSLATAELHLGRIDDAMAATEQGLAQFRAVGDLANEAVVLGTRGAVLRDTCRYEEAERDLRRAASLHEASGNQRLLGIVLGNLGLVMNDRGDHPEAVVLWTRSLALHRAVGNRRSEAILLSALASEPTDPAEQVARHHEALALHRELGNARFVAISLVQLGEALAKAGRLRDAAVTCDDALAACREIGNRRHEGIAQRHRGTLAALRGERDESRALYREAIAISREVRDTTGEAASRELLEEVEAGGTPSFG